MNMRTQPHILYVEDDPALGFVTKDSLIRRGYGIYHCDNGEDAIKEYNKKQYDLVILDIMLPKLDGLSVARHIRNDNKEIPIIFLTAKSLLEDKLEGLTIGGDDYLVKPFSIEELVLKIEIFLKRTRVFGSNVIAEKTQLGLYEFDPAMLTLALGEDTQKLTLRESELISFFVKNKGKLVSREDILNAVWGNDDYFNGRSLDVFISRLRKYFKQDAGIKLENRHGVGFVFSFPK